MTIHEENKKYHYIIWHEGIGCADAVEIRRIMVDNIHLEHI